MFGVEALLEQVCSLPMRVMGRTTRASQWPVQDWSTPARSGKSTNSVRDKLVLRLSISTQKNNPGKKWCFLVNTTIDIQLLEQTIHNQIHIVYFGRHKKVQG